MLKLEFQYRFEAAHRFTKVQSKCATPHGHSWRIQVQLLSRHPKLDDREMTEDFSSLKSQWRCFVDECLDHSFFHHESDPLVPFLKDHISEPRFLAFPGDPTTELLSALCFQKAIKIFENSAFEVHEIFIQETETNHLRCSLEAYKHLCAQYKLNSSSSWWNDPDPRSRSHTPKN